MTQERETQLKEFWSQKQPPLDSLSAPANFTECIVVLNVLAEALKDMKTAEQCTSLLCKCALIVVDFNALTALKKVSTGEFLILSSQLDSIGQKVTAMQVETRFPELKGDPRV